MDFTKADIEQIRIDIESEGQSALSMLIHKDGTLNRQGNGSLPPVKVAAIGMTDGAVFHKLLELLDERVFAHAGVYDMPEKTGTPIRYSLVFLGEKPKVKVFEFRVGLQNKEVGELLPYVDAFINNAAALTNDWYEKALVNNNAANKTVSAAPKKKWWQFGK